MEPGFYGIEAVAGAAPLGGVTGAKHVMIHGVAKANTTNDESITVNEFVAARIALCMGLPIAPGSLVRTNSGDLIYVMLRFGTKGETLPPVDPATVVASNPLVCAGIAMFDDLIANDDRHQGNLAYSPLAGVGIFDHSHALLGPGPRSNGLTRLQSIGDQPRFNGCLVPHLADYSHLRYWADRIEKINPDLLSHLSTTLTQQGLTTAPEAETIRTWLSSRNRNVQSRLQAAQAYFPGVTDWGLPI